MILLSITVPADEEQIFIRLTQVGFLPYDLKTAVVFSNIPVSDILFYIKGTEDYKEVYNGRIIQSRLTAENFKYTYILDFSPFNLPGGYVIEVDNQRSYPFVISENVFNNVTDSLMLFFRVQRCGPTNPYLHLPCHLSDASVVRGEEDSSAADLTGGWHDAGDYIKFLSTTAFTTYMLIFSYEFDKEKFGFDNDHNDVPDILEEAKIGLDWLLRAHFKKGKLITQVQDLRDHTPFWRMPEDDSLRYDRPAFTSFGKNHIGIFTAALALGARVWKERFLAEEFAGNCLQAAEDMYSVRIEAPDLGENLTAAYRDKEFNGKLALGAVELYLTTGEEKYLTEADEYAADLQPDFWWGWGNINSLAFYRLAAYDPGYKDRMYEGLNHFNLVKDSSVFNEGTAYSWGTTNALLGAALQAILYKRLTPGNNFDSLTVYQRDYVLGRNRWGICFISRTGSDYPVNIHSQLFYLNGGNLPGALVAGPAPLELVKNYSININDKKFDLFNTHSVIYCDDRDNYITNEPTIVSNATALFVFGNYSKR